PRRAPLDPAALRGRTGGLDVEGAGARTLFAHRLRKNDSAAPKPLAYEPIPVGVKTIDGLLAKLPIQTEIKHILRAIDAKKATGGIPLPTLDEARAKLPPVFTRAMDVIAALTGSFNPVELFTADDVVRVKKEFLAKADDGVLENPTFTYAKSTASLRAKLTAEGTSLEEVEAKLHALRREVLAEKPPRGDRLARVTKVALLEKIADDLATIELAHGLEQRDDRRVRSAFATKYGRGVDRALLDAARMVYGYLVETQAHAKGDEVRRLGAGNLRPELAEHLSKKESMTADEFKGAVEHLLAGYYRHYEEKTGKLFPEAAKFKVEVDEKYSAIDVRDKSSQGPIIGIPDKVRSYKKYLELLRHEVDQHVRQSLNGQLMFGLGGGALKVDEESWYEGLAKHAEITFMREEFGDESEPTLPYFTFAIDLAEKGKSFVEVFEALKALRVAAGSSEKLAAENAWNAAYRAFRGHIDTTNPDAYALPKDQAYLRGWMLQSQLAARGLGYLNESAISKLDGLALLARFDYGPEDLLFPDLDLTRAWMNDVLLPKAEAELAAIEAAEAERAAARAQDAERAAAKGAPAGDP
ncbi:flavohemoglobin expression-modulating QEGLA motif protein, partial [Myxococcota bacterium]|nr:flavohemoglobin expression-modulating QEGLA motif protein [Myxococcota bacterium]